jgi:hypothetical protein
MAKKTSPVREESLREAEQLELLQIRLLESHARLGKLRTGELPRHARQGVHRHIDIAHAEGSATVAITFRLVASYEAADEEPAVDILATFQARYQLPGGRQKRPTVEKAVEKVARLDLWPYWREFARSLTVRMDLPAFPVPLTEPGEALADERRTIGNGLGQK